ncbi:hypothetical protein [Pseudomonas sp. G166]
MIDLPFSVVADTLILRMRFFI